MVRVIRGEERHGWGWQGIGKRKPRKQCTTKFEQAMTVEKRGDDYKVTLQFGSHEHLTFHESDHKSIVLNPIKIFDLSFIFYIFTEKL